MSALNFPTGASMCLVTTTSAKTINLPTPDTGRFVYIVDSTGGASQFPITVSTTGTGVAILNGYSTITQPFGTLGYLANNNNWYAIINESGVNNLRTLITSNLSSASVSTNYGFFSTISTGSVYGKHIGDGSLLTGVPVLLPPILSTNVMSSGIITGNLISTLTLSTTFGYISSLTIDSLTFGLSNSYISMGDIITTSISTVQTYTSSLVTTNLQVGIASSLSYIAFPGLQLGYNQTIVAEQSTGTGTQELLLFRGSTATDRIRMQTTGSIVFEPGVGARVFPAVPSNVTPAMIINTSSNVGIGTATPGVALDVVGAGRFTAVSTNTVSTSQINSSNISNTGVISSLGLNVGSLSSINISSVSLAAGSISTITLGANLAYITNLFVGNEDFGSILTARSNITQTGGTTTLTGLSVNTISTNILAASNISVNTLSTNFGFFSTISAGTVYGKFVGDGSALTGLPASGLSALPSILSTTFMSTGFLSASNISALTMSTNYGFFSTISSGSVYGRFIGDGSGLTGLATGGTGVTNNLSTQAFYTSSISSANINSVQGYISSLTVDSLAFGLTNGFINMGDVITTSISSIQTYTSSLLTTNLQVGVVSSLSYIAFPGLQLGYNQSVIAEQSTGTGLQELLVFRGSSASDRIRLQTTGAIVFEPGVGARVFPAVPSNVTPAMIINTSSNVGIGIAAPTTTLDVAGTGRFQILSTQQLFVSTISSGAVYGKFIGDGSLLTGIAASGGSAALSTFTTVGVQYSTISLSSLFLMKAGVSTVAFGTNTSSLGQVYVGDLKNQLNFSSARDATFLLEQQLPMSNMFVSTFLSTGLFTVPQNVNFLNVHMWGGGGSNGGGGGGAYISGTLPVSSGSVLTVAVNTGFGNTGNAAGGGYAGLFLSTIAVNNILVIAGGGGASGSRVSDSGGYGGILQGGAGGYGGVGQGGTIGGGQSANTNFVAYQLQGEAQQAGGGGGFWGGQGGTNNSVAVVGGGGGSSYISNLLNFYGENGTSAITGGVGGGKGTPYNNGTYGDAGVKGAVVLVWSPGLRRANLMTIQDAFSRKLIVSESLYMGINVSTPNSNFSLEVAGVGSISTIITNNISTNTITVPYGSINAAAVTSSLGVFGMRTISNGQQIAFGTTGALGSVTPYGPVGKNSQIYINDVKNYLGNVSTNDAVVLIEQDMSLLSNTNVRVVQISTSVGYTVPTGVTAIRAFMWGAGGTNYPNGGSGGAGAFVAGTFNVNPGEVLSTVVNYGGGGGTYGGGGFSGIFRGAISQSNAIGIAGGGGAGSSHPVGGGGYGGVLAGGPAYYRWSQTGGGGTQTAGGTGGGNGSALQGGAQTTGGGGGYFGGAGNGNNSVDVVGGGGGSSYIAGLFNVLAEDGQRGNYAANNLAGGQWAPFASTWGNPATGGRIFMVYNTNIRTTNLLEFRTGYTSSITAITNFNTMGINVSSVLSSITLDVGGQGRFVTLSSQQLFVSSISSGNLYGKFIGDGSLLTGVSVVPPINSTLSTLYITGWSKSTPGLVVSQSSMVGFGLSTPLSQLHIVDLPYFLNTTPPIITMDRLGTSLVTNTIAFTDAYYYYTVPQSVFSITFYLWGGGGGGGGASAGGGAFVYGTVTVTPGSQVRVIVGKGGQINQSGTILSTMSDYQGGGGGGTVQGGGRTSVQLYIASTWTEVLTAGGGGGAARTNYGGNGGNAYYTGTSQSGSGGAGGGSSTAGGVPDPTSQTPPTALAGSAFTGGSAGGPNTSLLCPGGGGGYYGGGGGWGNQGGGGGGSYYNASYVTNFGGINGNGNTSVGTTYPGFVTGAGQGYNGTGAGSNGAVGLQYNGYREADYIDFNRGGTTVALVTSQGALGLGKPTVTSGYQLDITGSGLVSGTLSTLILNAGYSLFSTISSGTIYGQHIGDASLLTNIPNSGAVLTISNSLVTVSNNLTTVSNSGATNATNITTVSSSVVTNMGYLTTVSNLVNAVSTSATTISTNLNTVSNSLVTVSNNLTTVSNSTATNTTNITTISNLINAVSTNATTISTNLDTISNSLVTVSNNLTTVSNSTATNTTNITTISNLINAVSTNATTISTNLNTVSNSLVTVSNNLTTVSNSTATNTANISYLLSVSNYSAITLSTSYGFFSTISAGTVYGKHIGDGSGLTGLPASGLSIIPPVLSTTILSTGFLSASNISSFSMSTVYGFFSTISAGTVYGKYVGDGSLLTGITTTSTFTTVTTTSLTVTSGAGTINFTGGSNTSAYGTGVDTLSLKSQLTAYGGGIASLFFGNATAGYPLARIYAVDSVAAAPGASALVFQTAVSSLNAGLSGLNVFTYSGADQSYTVPSGVTSVTISMWGAGGGGGQAGGYGGGGAYVNGTLAVTAGMSLRIIVGQGGSVGASSSYGGGGFGNGAASGGGRSAIQLIQTGIVTGASASAGTITYTTSVAHRLQAGQGFIVSNLASGSVFNLTGYVASVLSATSFTLTNATTGTTVTGGTGTLTIELVDVGGGGGGPNCGGGAFSGSAGLTTGGSGSAETVVTGGTQTAAGSGGGGSAGTQFQAGTPGTNGGGYAGGGGGGFFPGGSGGSTSRAAGGGSSYITYSGLTVANSAAGNAATAVGTGDTYYVAGISVGAPSGGGAGGNGRVVIAASPSFVMTEAMRISSNAFVGIGMSNPSTMLDVAGSIRGSNLQIGTVSSLSYLTFPGLQQQYTQTVLAEVSTGTGLQEMLVFRGSSASDRIRMQTTGSIIFETGVGARVFPAAPSNVTPAMVINSSSNVGIGIAAPTVTLDVAGAGRFQTLSTQQIYASSFLGGVVSVATVYAPTVSSMAGYFSSVNNYQVGGAMYLPTQIFTF